VDLAPRSLAGLAIHECDGCRGLWVPAASFDALVAHARTREHAQASDGLGPETPAHPRPATAVTYRKCPVCRQVMNRKNFGRISGVIVDWCRADGTWLDASELEAIGAFVAGGGLERAADIDKEDERVAASMRAFDRIAQTPPVSDGNPVTLARVLATIFTK
jgi:Zn-finger nucleic acid-binding protein